MAAGALQVARTGLDAQDVKMRVIANNLANVNTLGFKADRANFETLAYQQIVANGTQADSQNKLAIGLNLGTGVQLKGTERIETQGTMQQTSNSLDLAIEGQGYFQVQQPDGTVAYTRAGNFKQNADGLLVTTDGLPVQPQIQLPTDAQSISIGTDGTVSVTVAGQQDPTVVGQLQTARFVNPAGLQAVSNNLLLPTAASGEAQVGNPGEDGRGAVRQGMLEQSNVNTVEQLVDMIETQRAYEVASKMIKSTDEMMQYVNQQL